MNFPSLTVEQSFELQKVKTYMHTLSTPDLIEMLSSAKSLLKVKTKLLMSLTDLHSKGCRGLPPLPTLSLELTERVSIVQELEQAQTLSKQDLSEVVLNHITSVMLKDNMIKDYLRNLNRTA